MGRNDSASSGSTNTFRMSRSSMSSNDHSMARSGSNYSSKSGKPYNLARMATENSAAAILNKPKLMRQAAILADGDSTGSAKSVTFQEPAGIGSARRFVAATADLGACPLHSHERYKLLYDKLVETAKAQAAVVTPEEESDMEASDVEDDVPNVNSDSMPMGATFRTILVSQNQNENFTEQPKLPSFVPRKLSTISSQDSERIPEETESPAEAEIESDHMQLPPPEMQDEENENLVKTTDVEVHAKRLNQTDFEWHPEDDKNDDSVVMGVSEATGLPCPSSAEEAAMVASEAAEDGKDPESEALLSKSSEIDTKTLPSTSVQPARSGSRYKNTHV